MSVADPHRKMKSSQNCKKVLSPPPSSKNGKHNQLDFFEESLFLMGKNLFAANQEN